MRADRLLAILLLLQSRGRISAPALATELEVSERTIYRDIDALNAAGIPIYGEAGRAGGYQLLESYRTTLTGLTKDEIQALFLLNVPQSLAELGIGRDLHSALRKLAAALPAGYHADEIWVRQRFYLDTTWWHQGDDRIPHLDTIHQAVRQNIRVTMMFRPVPTWQTRQTVNPYGLVAKAGAWYLVCGHHGQVSVYRVNELLDAQLTNQPAERPEDFDLAGFWHQWCAEQEETRQQYRVQLRVARQFIAALPIYFGEPVRARIAAGTIDHQGRLTLDLAFASLETARDRILVLGSGVEVLAPRALRLSIIDFADQIAAAYQKR